jgi:hypothetical protein
VNTSCTDRGGGTEVCQRQSDFPLGLHVVSEDAELVAVPTSLSRRVGLSAPEASSADEPLGAAATPLVRLGADGCSATASGRELAGVKWRVLALGVRPALVPVPSQRWRCLQRPSRQPVPDRTCCSLLCGPAQRLEIVGPCAPELARKPQQPLGIATADRRRRGPI